MAVDPYLGNIYEIPFGQSGMVAHENRWLSQKTDMLVAENLTFDNDVFQKDSAVTVYDPIGVDAPLYRMLATSTAPGNWEAGMTINGNNGVAGLPLLVRNLAVGSQASPWNFTVGATCPAGSVVVVSFWAASVNTPVVTDNKGNVYTLSVGFGLTGAPSDPAGLSYFQYQGQILTQLTAGIDAITLTWTGGVANVFVVAGLYPTTGAFGDLATATATATVNLVCPKNAPATLVANHAFNGLYPLIGIGGAFLDQDTGTATITGALTWTVLAVANLPGFGQLVQMYSSLKQRPAIVAQIDWNSQFNAGAIAGTVTVTQNSTTITGAGTAFTTAFSVNDEILINNEAHAIASITSNTILNTYVAFGQNTAAGQTAIRRAGPRIITAVIQNVVGPNSLGIYKERNPGSVYPFPGLAGVLLFSDFTMPRLGRFVVAGKEAAASSRKLFFFNGVEPVNFLADDGNTMNAIPTPPADWGAAIDANKQPINGILHQSALYGWGNLSDPHRLYRSQTADHTTFVGGDSGTYPIASSIGERLFCGAEFQGVLFLWKYPRGIFYFDDTDSNFLNWSYHTRSEAIGCAPSPHAVLSVDDDIIFCAPDGHFHLLSAVADLGGVSSSDLTRMLGLHRWTREHVDIPSLTQLCSAYNTYTKTAYFGVRSRSAVSQDNDLLLKFDFGLVKRGGPIRFSYSTAFLPNALCIRRSASSGNPKDGTPLLMIGELSTSMLQVLDDGTVGTKLTHGFRNDPIREARLISTSYAITGSLPRLDFADVDPMNRQRKKNYDSIEFIFGETDISDMSGQTLTAKIFVDGMLQQTMTLANITATRVMRQLRTGDGYDWQVVLSTSSVTTQPATNPVVVPDIVLNGLQVYWRPGSQDHGNVLT